MVRREQVEADHHPLVETAEPRKIVRVFQAVMTVEMHEKAVEPGHETRREILDFNFSSPQFRKGFGCPRAFATQVLVNGKPETGETLDVKVAMPILTGMGGAQKGDFVR